MSQSRQVDVPATNQRWVEVPCIVPVRHCPRVPASVHSISLPFQAFEPRRQREAGNIRWRGVCRNQSLNRPRASALLLCPGGGWAPLLLDPASSS